MRAAGSLPKSARRARIREKREEWSDESRPRPSKVGEKGGLLNPICFCSVIPAFAPVIPAFYPRHSRESGNPQVGEPPSPPETKQESRATNPLSFYGLTGQVCDLGARASRPQSRACARRALTLALSHKGLIGVGFEIRLSGEGRSG